MKKLLTFYLLILCLGLTSCGPAPQTSMQTTTETSYTFTDDLDRIVTVDSPKRVAALLGSFAQIWMLAGGEICATADDAWDDLLLDLPEDAINLGNTKSLNLELLLSSEPDFILASTNTRQNLEWQETLDASRIPTAYFDVSDFDDYLRLLKICTDITGCKDLYQTNGLDIQEEIESVIEKRTQFLEKNEEPKVLSLIASASNVYAKNSQNNVLGEMLYTLGCNNIADSDHTLLENLSIEHILLENPDYIFIVQRGDDAEGTKARVEQLFSENPAWTQLDAIKNDRVYFMEKNLYNLKPNRRWGEAYKKLEEILSND
jgi:iron complex transport system substrate-binding protein